MGTTTGSVFSLGSLPSVGQEMFLLLCLVVAYVLIGTTTASGEHSVAGLLFWKTATARPPVLIVLVVAGWAGVVAVAERRGLKLEAVIGEAPPVRPWTTFRCAVALLDAILVCKLAPFAARLAWGPAASVPAWSLFGDACAFVACVVALVLPPSRFCRGAASPSSSSSGDAIIASKDTSSESRRSITEEEESGGYSASRARLHAKYGHGLAYETSHARDSLARAIWDALLAPFAPVTFWHVIVADYATSLAKGLGDAHVTACVAAEAFVRRETFFVERAEGSMTAALVETTAGSSSSSQQQHHHSVWWEERRGPCASSVVNASALALPFWCRLFQCCAVYKETRHPKNLWNALKYATAFPLVYAGYLQKVAPTPHTRIFFVCAAIAQSSATFAWDVLMDWGLFDEKAGGALCGLFDPRTFRSSYVFLKLPTRRNVGFLFLIAFDFALRFVWTLAVFGVASTRGFGMFGFELVEVLRRTVWALFRIEWELYNHGIEPVIPRPSSERLAMPDSRHHHHRRRHQQDSAASSHNPPGAKLLDDDDVLQPQPRDGVVVSSSDASGGSQPPTPTTTKKEPIVVVSC